MTNRDPCEQLVRLHKEALEQGLLQQMRIGFVDGMEDDAAKIKMKLSTLQLAQKLVMIFLVVPEPRTLQLGLACKIIYAGSKQPVAAQAWLAEIATVLVSLGLLRCFGVLTLPLSLEGGANLSPFDFHCYKLSNCQY